MLLRGDDAEDEEEEGSAVQREERGEEMEL
jgi:hypothetical protein